MNNPNNQRRDARPVSPIRQRFIGEVQKLNPVDDDFAAKVAALDGDCKARNMLAEKLRAILRHSDTERAIVALLQSTPTMDALYARLDAAVEQFVVAETYVRQ